MTKLEQKLIELGYKTIDCKKFRKFKDDTEIVIEIQIDKIDCFYVDNDYLITNQKCIDNLQQAFNEMQKDLEELRKYEKFMTIKIGSVKRV